MFPKFCDHSIFFAPIEVQLKAPLHPLLRASPLNVNLWVVVTNVETNINMPNFEPGDSFLTVNTLDQGLPTWGTGEAGRGDAIFSGVSTNF
jgi:hypothetical protein